MTILKAIFLGAVQGLTEFLPVSSSGHLVFFQTLFGLEVPPIFFDVMVHGGTLLAILVYLFKDIIFIIRDFISCFLSFCRHRTAHQSMEDHPGGYIVLLLIAATIPTAIMGFFLRGFFVSLFGSLRAVGFAWLFNGVILWFTHRIISGEKDITGIKVIDAILIGIAQGCAITPGLSRSGLTISAGLLRKLGREWAVKFSLFLAIPAILGAIVYEGGHLSPYPVSSSGSIIAGTAVAAIVGYLAIRLLMRVTKAGSFFKFAFYSWGAGALALAVSFVTR